MNEVIEVFVEQATLANDLSRVLSYRLLELASREGQMSDDDVAAKLQTIKAAKHEITL